MARARRPSDWGRDLAGARPIERMVCEALRRHPEVSRLSDFTEEMELDFEFRFEGEQVNLDVKVKGQPLSEDYLALWPEVPPQDLLVLDETAFRQLAWAEGMGYLAVLDKPIGRWLYFGPWELALGPRRRFERLGDKGAGDFLKGKLLLDLRTAADETADLQVGALLDVVRRSRGALHIVEAVRLRSGAELPTIPRQAPSAAPAGGRPLRSTAETTEARSGPRAREPEGDATWAGLSADIVAAIQGRWGWEQPTPVQRRAFPSILYGDNVLVLGPTAGGKTEAALLPLLDRWRSDRWPPTSILALSPLKALLEDQLARYRRAAALVGARAFAWHGDVERADKRAFLDHPADILLTTPESLELVLSSPSYDQRRLFSRLQAVVVDEVHAFVSTPRGAQLASLLERLDRFSTSDIQRVGLSATVGNPAEVLNWLRGGSLRPPVVASEAGPMQGEVLSILSYESLDQAVAAIRAATEGERALAFARSRRRAEELGAPVHHSSVSSEERSATAAALASGDVPLVVATSSLELGIDIGDLDLVVHDGAPSGPASYLQRLGRAGRRTGVRRMLFTTGEPEDLLLILAALARVRRGDLESLHPGRGARLVLGQQAIALAFERTAVERRELFDALRWSPAFSTCSDAIDPTIEHLLHAGWLVAVGDQLVIGPKAQSRFGGHRFRDLLATFEGSEGALVVDGDGRRIGSIDWDRVADEGSGNLHEAFRLAGRPWAVVAVDREQGIVQVRPAERGKAPSWRGPALEADRATWEAAREVLAATDVPVDMDERAAGWLEQTRGAWKARLERPLRASGENATTLDGFAGVGVHRAVLAALDLPGTAEGPTCEVAAPVAEVRQRAAACLADMDRVLEDEAQRQAAGLRVRHRELVPPPILIDEARAYHVDAEGIRRVLILAAGEATWPS